MVTRIRIRPAVVLGAVVLAAAMAGQVWAQDAQPAPPSAPPASTNTPAAMILVVDRGEVLRNSAAGKKMLEQIDTLGKSMQTEYEPEQKKLQEDAQGLQSQLAVLAPSAREERQRALRDRQVALQRKVQERQAQIQGGINKARSTIEQALNPILEQITRERNANMLVERGLVVWATADIDITQVAVQRLDTALPTVTVELVPVPQEILDQLNAQAQQGGPAPGQ